MNRPMNSRVRADSSEAKKNEKTSTRPSLLSEKMISHEKRVESPVQMNTPTLQKQPSEQTQLKREKSTSRVELKKTKSEVKRELNEILGEDKMKLAKEKRMAEKLEREKIEQEEREMEEKRQKYLEEEHRRWKFKEKVESKGGKKRTTCGRLFLQVGESSEFEENNNSNNDNNNSNNEEIKVIQGTLAAELLELIEKTRGVRPVEVKRTDSKVDQNSVVKSPQNIKTNEPDYETRESESSFDEEEYFREIAALSLETEGDDGVMNSPRGLGKVIIILYYYFIMIEKIIFILLINK